MSRAGAADDLRGRDRWSFATRALGGPPGRIERASEDASFRSYWRVFQGARTWILMDAPPDREDCRPFVAVARRLGAAGLRPPAIHGVDLAQGFLLLEDLGDTLFADVLGEDTVDSLFSQAFGILARMARMDHSGLPPYDRRKLAEELALFPDWYVARQLARPVEEAFRRWWEPLVETLVQTALSQPIAFVHRDFHCGNLMTGSGEPAILDFQDAVAGPVTYDLVSLLYDRHHSWPDAQLEAWSEAHRRVVAAAVDPGTWRRWVDCMALQRNLKIVGIFARLKLRDGKPRYLAWQPRFLGYLQRTALRYPEFEGLTRFLSGEAPASSARS